MTEIRIELSIYLEVSDNLLARLKSGELNQFVLKNAFRNNNRTLSSVKITNETKLQNETTN